MTGSTQRSSSVTRSSEKYGDARAAAADLQTAPVLTDNALRVLETRYLQRGSDGAAVETPGELFQRVARTVAAVETVYGGDAAAWAERFECLLASLDFLPNSPALFNAGCADPQLSACFVLPLADSLQGIFETLRDAATTHNAGGGTGFSLSRIRPRQDAVRGVSGAAAGPVAVLRMLSSTLAPIRQGLARQGANMAVLDVTHPDVLEFVEAKLDGGLDNFNISVGVTSDWMTLAASGADYRLVNPRTCSPAGRRSASAVLERISEAAWRTGDPGLVFLDRINEPRTNPTPSLGSIEATNPCGEAALLPNEACVLGSINLSHFDDAGALASQRLSDTVRLAVRFLDDCIDASSYPVAAMARSHRDGNRKIGLGVMGWADLLIRWGIPYDSDEAVDRAREVARTIETAADAASEELAAARGCFGNWRESVYGPGGWNRRMRNATRTTIAPTGSIAIIAGCSAGIEPLFGLSYSRHVADGATLTETNALFEEALRTAGVWSDDVVRLTRARGECRSIESLPTGIRRLFGTARDIAPLWHLRHQAAFQDHTDNGVSKTINLSESATVEDVHDICLAAWRFGCHGITIYRDRSKDGQVIDVGATARSAGRAATVAPADEHRRCMVCGAPAPQVGCSVCPACGIASC